MGNPERIEQIKKQLRGLSQNKSKTEEELNALSQETYNRQEILGNLKFCINDEEKKFAKDLLEKYLESKSFVNPAERDTLRNLIDFEVILDRVKDYINKETSKSNPVPPVQMIDQLQKFSEHIEELKEKLDLVQKKDEKNDIVKTTDNLLERFHKWINKPENRSNYEFQCPKCAEIFLIRRRLDKITDEVKEHPWFIDGGILFNKQIFIDLELGKISESQASRYLDSSLDYITWIKQNYPLNQDKNEETENEE